MSPITQTPIPLSDEWATPRDLFDTFDAEFHFTLDGAARDWNAKLPRYCSETLTLPWAGEVVWLNPPYSDVATWLAKAEYEATQNGATVVALVPCSPDRHWWAEYVEGRCEVRLLTRRILKSGRVHFEREDGTKGRAPFASALLIYRGPAPRVPTPPSDPNNEKYCTNYDGACAGLRDHDGNCGNALSFASHEGCCLSCIGDYEDGFDEPEKGRCCCKCPHNARGELASPTATKEER